MEKVLDIAIKHGYIKIVEEYAKNNPIEYLLLYRMCEYDNFEAFKIFASYDTNFNEILENIRSYIEKKPFKIYYIIKYINHMTSVYETRKEEILNYVKTYIDFFDVIGSDAETGFENAIINGDIETARKLFPGTTFYRIKNAGKLPTLLEILLK